MWECVAYVCVHVGSACVHVCIEDRDQQWSFSILTLALRGVSGNLELTGSSRLVCKQALGTILSQPPQDWDCSACCGSQLFA